VGARHVRANGLRFAYLEQGPADGPLALCLHGFPDHAQTWRHLLPELAEAGFHAVAPWMRGYAPSEVPSDRATHPTTLTADVNALHRALGGGPDAVLIGHDWGGIIGARAAAAAPERWRSVVTMAVPVEAAMRPGSLDRHQLRRSWYTLLAQLPNAESRFLRDDLALVERLWRDWSPSYEPEGADLDVVKRTLAEPGVMRAALSYYRGFARAVLTGEAASPRVPLPPQGHLLLHGAEDGCIDPRLVEASAPLLPHPRSRVEIVTDVGHFLHLEDPPRVNGAILAHVTAKGRPPRGGARAPEASPPGGARRP
jgi:pimeloyl-ACP methyl ester carboxylesterase